MTEIDYLKLKLEDREKAFNKLLKLHIKSLKKQGKLEKENKELKTQLEPIQKICKKYKIPLEDLPEVLEEYITYDNEEYLEKLQNQ